VCERIIESGRALSHAQRSSSRLMYEWHDKKYLGAAHGLVGILHTLLLASTSSFVRSFHQGRRLTVGSLSACLQPTASAEA